MRPQLFVDLDGVLADFDLGFFQRFGRKKHNGGGSFEDADWQAVRGTAGFYADLPPMPDMRDLWAYVEKHHPYILTGIPSSVAEACANKKAWVERNLGPEWAKRTLCCQSKEKFQYCLRGDVLIDDWERYKDLWEKAGGVWITHSSAAQSIADLKRLGM